jgi:threonine synthase
VRQAGADEIVFATPSGNFGNLTAGLMAKRAGLPVARFIAATNANDVVPAYLDTGRFEPRPSVTTLANAMDVGHPSNFERMSWLYGGDVNAMRRDVSGCRFTDQDVRATIKHVYEKRGYLLDPHSAIAYMGLVGRVGQPGQVGRVGQMGRLGQTRGLGEAGLGRTDVAADNGRIGIFLATAHPAKFAEIVEPIIGHAVEKPAALAQALARPRHIIRIDPSLAAVTEMLDA